MILTGVERSRQRSMEVCRKCDKFSAHVLDTCKCRLDDGYKYECAFSPWLIEDKYIRCKLNKQCPYILEHLILRRRKKK